MYVYMYVCMYVSMYACMYVCMYVRVYAHMHSQQNSKFHVPITSCPHFVRVHRCSMCVGEIENLSETRQNNIMLMMSENPGACILQERCVVIGHPLSLCMYACGAFMRVACLIFISVTCPAVCCLRFGVAGICRFPRSPDTFLQT